MLKFYNFPRISMKYEGIPYIMFQLQGLFTTKSENIHINTHHAKVFYMCQTVIKQSQWTKWNMYLFLKMLHDT